jgi:hypothetical protein
MIVIVTKYDFLNRLKPFDICKEPRKRTKKEKTSTANWKSYWRILKSGAVLRKGNSTFWIFSRHLKAVLCNINDATTLKQSTVTNLEFLWNYIHLSKGSIFPKKNIFILETGNTWYQELLLMGLRWHKMYLWCQ